MFVRHYSILEASFEQASGGYRELVTEYSRPEGQGESDLEVSKIGLDVPPFHVRKRVDIVFGELRERAPKVLDARVEWSASGPKGLFPVWDGRLELAGHGSGRTRLSLSGNYFPPVGGAGEAMDRIAKASTRDFLDAWPQKSLRCAGHASAQDRRLDEVAVEDAGPVDPMKGVAAAAVRFLPETFLLRDGRQVLIRGIESRDEPLLAEFYAGLCEGSRRLRFLGYMAPLSGELIQRMVTVDFRDRIALVATVECEGRLRLVADCRLAPARPGKAEIAIAVADDFQNAGLGRALLRLMLGLAAQRRLQEVVAEVRYDNTKMMRLLRSVGFRRVAWEVGIATFVYRCRRLRRCRRGSHTGSANLRRLARRAQSQPSGPPPGGPTALPGSWPGA